MRSTLNLDFSVLDASETDIRPILEQLKGMLFCKFCDKPAKIHVNFEVVYCGGCDQSLALQESESIDDVS